MTISPAHLPVTYHWTMFAVTVALHLHAPRAHFARRVIMTTFRFVRTETHGSTSLMETFPSSSFLYHFRADARAALDAYTSC